MDYWLLVVTFSGDFQFKCIPLHAAQRLILFLGK